jgi:hypothetical protein
LKASDEGAGAGMAIEDELKKSEQRGGQIVPETIYEAAGHGRDAGGHL